MLLGNWLCYTDWNGRMRVSTGAVEAAEVNIRPINSEVVSQEEVSGSLEQKNLVDYSAERKKSLQARYSYGIIFLVTNLIAWFIRDYGQRLLPQLHCKSMFFLSSPPCCRYLIETITNNEMDI